MTTLLTAVFLTASCRKAPSLNISPSSIEVTSEGGFFECTVTANYEWTASCDASWVKVTVNKDGTKFNVTVSPNMLPDDREASVTLICEELITNFRIKQAQKDMAGLDKGDVYVSWEHQSFEVGMQTNVDFRVDITMEGDWLTLVTTKGLVSKTLLFEVQENAARTERQAKLDISHEGTVLKSFTITQDAFPNIIKVVHNQCTFDAPIIIGTRVKGTIDWGDGNKATYNSTLSHTYDTGEKHEVLIEVSGAEYTSMPNLKGVLKVDLSNF